MQIGSSGSLPRNDCLRSSPSSAPWLALKVDASLKSVWRTQALLRAAFFAWSVALGKILTMDNLRKRHIIIVDRCCLCKRDGESVDHLLLHCDVASAMWNNIFLRFSMSWVMSRRVIDLFECWWKSRRPRNVAIWKMVPICIFWCVWKEINLRYFKDFESSMEDILASFFFIRCIFVQWLFCPHCRLALLISLFVFLFLIRCFLLYTSNVLRGALHFQ
jgi:hypothetical protein